MSTARTCSACVYFPEDHVGKALCQNPDNSEDTSDRALVRKLPIVSHTDDACDNFKRGTHHVWDHDKGAKRTCLICGGEFLKVTRICTGPKS